MTAFREWLSLMRFFDTLVPPRQQKFVGVFGHRLQDPEVSSWARTVQHPEFPHRTRN